VETRLKPGVNEKAVKYEGTTAESKRPDIRRLEEENTQLETAQKELLP
jgi:hypothetical protein